jgi:NhaA family Na+:H+ antiporter
LKDKVLSHIEAFLRGESTAGLILMAAAALALVVANSPAASLYESARAFSLAAINDGLMAFFFLLVGLEIKREIAHGELSTRASAALPVIAAAGGMIGPALVYAAINHASALDLRGWAIPSATDIAFALGILALLGSRVPVSLKIFLTALAIIDDLGAIAIIALFYTEHLSGPALAAAAALVAALVALNRFGARAIWIYLILGALLWFAILKSGVHPTMAGVITALAIPAAEENGASPLTRLESALHPWVTFFILPVFAFANAGIALSQVTGDVFTHPVTLGIVLGLFLGKQIGVLSAVYAARRFNWVVLPRGATARQFYGVAVLTGVGFTMSLFIGMLAFIPPLYNAELKVGVLAGSLVSGLAGYMILRWPSRH